ncbi:VanZ family protein [Mangrovitalea sediminis]|uniref:succinyl-CoA synthetase subunit beta n=1 Tax=Mangrovitalea sediminis TaxID=1982043 RepID=UPI000BE572C2|nr:succinyl-CoA synthetase subunit beta [Mangrovitalea sediminis]
MTAFIVNNACWIRRFSLAAVMFATPLFFWGGPECNNCDFYNAVWNLGHPAFFALLMIVVRPWRSLKGWRLWLFVSLSVIAIGGLIEVVQGFVGRDMDIQDVYRDLTGSWLILAWLPTHMTQTSTTGRGTSPFRQAIIRTIASGLILFELAHVAVVGTRQLRIAESLPALYDFSRPPSPNIWTGEPMTAAHLLSRKGYYPLMATLRPGAYPGVFLDNLPHDWSAYRFLVVVLDNPEKRPLRLTLRVNDAKHDEDGQAYNDRFNLQLTVKPGLNRFNIPLRAIEEAPLGRQMNMHHITRLGIFASNLHRTRSFFLLGLHLQ